MAPNSIKQTSVIYSTNIQLPKLPSYYICHRAAIEGIRLVEAETDSDSEAEEEEEEMEIDSALQRQTVETQTVPVRPAVSQTQTQPQSPSQAQHRDPREGISIAAETHFSLRAFKATSAGERVRPPVVPPGSPGAEPGTGIEVGSGFGTPPDEPALSASRRFDVGARCRFPSPPPPPPPPSPSPSPPPPA